MLKKCGRSFVSLLLVFVLVVSFFTVSFSAAPGKWLWGTGSTGSNVTKSLSYTIGTGTKKIDFKDAKISYRTSSNLTKYADVVLHDDATKSIDITINTTTYTLMELTFKAYVPSGYIMRFDYQIEQPNGIKTQTLSFAPKGATSSVTYKLEDGGSYMVVCDTTSSGTPNSSTFTFAVEGKSQTYKAHMNNIQLVPAENKSVTVKAPAAGGSVTAGETTINAGDADVVFDEVMTDTGIELSAVPASGYVFAGYKINGGSQLIAPTGANYTFFPTANGDTIQPVFVPTNEPRILVGNMNGFEVVEDLRTAIEEATNNNYHYIIPITDVSVEDDGDAYNIPSGVTLVIPNDAEHNVYRTEPCILYSSGSGYRTKNPDRATTLAKIGPTQPYVTFTVCEDAVINVESGAEVSVGGIQWSPNGGGAAQVRGGYGLIVMEEGAQMNFANGSFLYAWGFIVSDPPATADSDPSIVCASGATVYEMFQITDYSGGSIISDIATEDGGCIFPFSQYYVQNIEAKLKLNAGAEEHVCGALTVSSNAVATSLTFIGSGSAMFALNSGCAIKYYDYERDKLICRLDEGANAAINSMSLNVGIDLNTANFQLPISNIGVEVAGGSNVTINQDLQLYPDSYVTLDEESALTIKSNVYVADKETIAGHVMGGVSVKPMLYSATLARETGDGKSYRTAADMDEPYVVNDGAVTIEPSDTRDNVGSLNFVGEGGTLTGSGTIVNYAAESVVPEEIKLINFYYDPDKGRQSGRQEPDPGENDTQCADIEAVDEEGNPLPYSYDADRDIWHTDEVTVHFFDTLDEEYTEEFTVAYGESVTAPTRTADGYSLKWINDNDPDDTYQPGDPIEALRFASYTTEWTELPAEPGDPSHSLSLEGQIHVNFYWPIEGSSSGYTYTFSFMNQTTDPLPLPTDPDPNFGYKTSIAVDAPEMTYPITATLYKDGVALKTDTFKASDYAKAFNDQYEDTPTELEDNTPYLIGKINGSTDWSKANPKFKFTDNPNNADEYMLSNVPLTAGDEIKVVKYYSGTGSYGWYPDGSGNNYVIDQNGVYNIYFKKNPDGYTEGWFEGKFYVETVSLDNSVYQARLLPTLLQATMDYGAKAQIFFNTNTENLADAELSYKGVFGEVTQDMIDARLNDAETRPEIADNVFDEYGLEYYGSSLVMNSNTKIKLYFGVKDAAVFDTYKDSFTFNGTHVDAVPANKQGDLVCFTLDGIAPANLHVRYILANENGGSTLDYAALDYATLCMDLKTAADGSSDKKLYDLTQALYWYNVYADAYFKNAT